jgi:hypothetical protein
MHRNFISADPRFSLNPIQLNANRESGGTNEAAAKLAHSGDATVIDLLEPRTVPDVLAGIQVNTVETCGVKCDVLVRGSLAGLGMARRVRGDPSRLGLPEFAQAHKRPVDAA